MGNVVHAILPYIPRVVIQIGAAAVSPIALLAAVHGFALTVRAGASRRVYCWAVSAVAAIGVGAFAVSFLALRDLMRVIGYSPATGSIFPALIDTAVAVSTMMLVALGDKPARRARMVKTSAGAKISPVRGLGQRYRQDLWISEFQATSDPAVSGSAFDVSGVMSTGRSSNLPLWNTAPARTTATRCGAFTARQRDCAASISL